MKKHLQQIVKILIKKSQLILLAQNFIIIEGKGLCPNKENLITESKIKEFAVKVFFNGWPCYIRVGTQSSGSALAVARLMFPKARITGIVTSL